MLKCKFNLKSKYDLLHHKILLIENNNIKMANIHRIGDYQNDMNQGMVQRQVRMGGMFGQNQEEDPKERILMEIH